MVPLVSSRFFYSLEQAGLSLDQEQQQAVQHLRGPLQVIAGPGSGKTRVITARTAALIAAGVNPHAILVLTFTRAAANEMKERLPNLAIIGRQARAVTMCTFHSLCYKLLEAYQGRSPAVVSQGQQRRWIQESLRRQQEDAHPDQVEELLHTISYNKNHNIDFSAVRHQRTLLARVWGDYEAAKEAARMLDYDDLLLDTYRLLREKPQLLRSLRRRWQYIMVDEFQDTNLVQYELLKLLAAPANNLCVVGDIDQAIYAWRAAEPRLLLQFQRDFPDSPQVQLTSNYRSTPPIIELAKRLIVHNKLRHPTAMQAVRQGNIAPRLFRPSDEWAEAKAVLSMLKQCQTNKIPLEEMAILYRVNSQARPLVSLLMEANIPFSLREKGLLDLDHWVIREVHAFLRLLVDPTDTTSFLQVGRRQLRLQEEASDYLYRLIRRSGGQITPWDAYQQLPREYADISRLKQLQRHLATARTLLPSSALKYYLENMGFGSYLEWAATHHGYPVDHYCNLCDDLLPDLRRFTSVRAYLHHIDRMLQALQQETAGGGVNLMTLHRAKGLEFEAVWIIGIVKGLLPHSLSQTADEIEEERRLLYVGCTRAKDYLHLLAPRSYRGEEAEESPFLAEAFGAQFASQLGPSSSGQAAPAPQRAQSAAAVAGGRYATAEQAAHSANTQPPPQVGQSVRHYHLGLGTIVSCTRQQAGGKDFHVLTIDFPARTGFKLHWELSLEMGIVDALQRS